MTLEEWAKKRRAEFDAKPKPPLLPPSKTATLIGTRYFLHVTSHVVYGISVQDRDGGYEAFLPTDATAQLVGEACRQALATSRFIPPHHPDFDRLVRFTTKEEQDAWDAALKRRAGVKSLKALYTGSGYVSLTQTDENIEIEPARYRRLSSFEAIPNSPAFSLPVSVTDTELGTAVLKALADARAAAP